MREENAYILGTDQQELHRLGVQHQVWAEEAQKGWRKAGFKEGDTILDLGSGPGFCTKELGYIVGATGKVIAVDMSEGYINHLNELNKLHGLNIQGVLADFNSMKLEPNSLDGMYCRWALAWLPNPEEILQKVKVALKPGAKMVIHEYYDWSTHQTEPSLPGLNKGIAAALQSFKQSDSEIDIGRFLPAIFENIGMHVDNTRLMSKLAKPNNLEWEWPKTFYKSYFPRLVDYGLLTNEDVTEALSDLEKLENTPGVTLCCPLMIEVIASR